MVEYTQMIKGDIVEVARATAVGENTIQVGEDLIAGQIAIPAGRRIRAAEIGGLMALGRTRIKVARQPRVGLISSGDEVVPPDQKLVLGQVRDVNAHSLSAVVRSAGGIPKNYGIAPDRAEDLREKVKMSLEECDVTLITAGSSVSVRDITAQVINQCGAPGVIVHGVNIKPGKPTILGLCDGKAVIGLPGNPVSALVIAMQFVTPTIEALLGLKDEKIQNAIIARLAVNVASQAGREDWVPVRLIRTDSGDDVGFLADPVFGKSNLIFTLTRANGFIRIPPVSTGLESGEIVDVILMST
jgi:molybdopterin molybdotransferase